jgi:hypothetical protein
LEAIQRDHRRALYRTHVIAIETLFRAFIEEKKVRRISAAMVKNADGRSCAGIEVEVYKWWDKKKCELLLSRDGAQKRAERDGFPVKVLVYVEPEEMSSQVLLIKPKKAWWKF